jgi:hypothetical protein
MVEQVLRQADVLSKQSGATGDTAKLLVQQAEAEFTRVERLFEKGYVTQGEYNRAKRELDRARAAAEEVKTSVAGHGNPAAPTDAGKAAQSAESAKQSPTPGSVTHGNAVRRHTERPPDGQARLQALLNTDADNPEPGAPIDEEKLQRLAWGPAAPNGLRAACYFEPTKEAYADGEEVVRRLVFHNSGKEPVLFTHGSASESSHQGWVVVEEPIPVPVERQFGLGGGWSVTYRLAPGHAVEDWPPRRVRLGASTKPGQGVHAAIQAKPGTTCRARWSIRVLETMRLENGKRVPVTSVWHGTLTTGEVRFRIVEKEADRAPKESLHYGGKTFKEWQSELETELKSERRVEAIRAFAALGSLGSGKEATEEILNVMRQVPVPTPSDYKGRTGSEEQLFGAAIAAFAGKLGGERVPCIDPKVSEPILLEEVMHGSGNGRRFAAAALAAMGQSAEPALATLVQLARAENNREDRKALILAVFSIDQSGKAIVPLLNELVRSKDSEMLQTVLKTRTDWQMRLVSDLVLVEWENRTTIKSKKWSPKGRAVLQFLMELIDNPEPALRRVAFDQLGELQVDARDAVPALVGAFRRGTNDDRVQVLRTLVQIGEPAKSAIPALERLIEQVKDTKVRQEFENRLRSIGSRGGPGVGPAAE